MSGNHRRVRKSNTALLGICPTQGKASQRFPIMSDLWHYFITVVKTKVQAATSPPSQSRPYSKKQDTCSFLECLEHPYLATRRSKWRRLVVMSGVDTRIPGMDHYTHIDKNTLLDIWISRCVYKGIKMVISALL